MKITKIVLLLSFSYSVLLQLADIVRTLFRVHGSEHNEAHADFLNLGRFAQPFLFFYCKYLFPSGFKEIFIIVFMIFLNMSSNYFIFSFFSKVFIFVRTTHTYFFKASVFLIAFTGRCFIY